MFEEFGITLERRQKTNKIKVTITNYRKPKY